MANLTKTLTLILITSICFAKSLDAQKIDYLLESIKTAQADFYRNGEVHTSEKAYEHILFKLNYAKKAFFFFGPEKDIRVDDFINKIASHSSSSGEDYYIQDKGEKKVKVKDWLRKKLKNFRQKK